MGRSIALLATGRRTFVQEAGIAVHAAARSLLTELGATINGPETLVEFAAEVPDGFPGPDAVLNILLCATFADASVALAAFGRSEVPVVLWAVRDPAPLGERLYLNSLCGANLAAHALVRQGVAVLLLYGNPDEAPVRNFLVEALAGRLPNPASGKAAHGECADPAVVTAAVQRLTGAVIGVIGEAPTGFTTCEYEPDWLDRNLGLRVRTMTLEEAFDRIAAVPESIREAELVAATLRSPSLRDLPEEGVQRHAAVTSALRDWTAEERLAALALRCWPEFPLEFGVCPCSALGRLASEGIATACEADVNGAATMLLMRELDPERGLTYLADVVRVDEATGTATFWHCGLAPVELAADPENATQGLHCNRGIGVAGNFPLRAGRVTIARLGHSRGGYRLLLGGGTALAAPNRFKGNSIDVRMDGDAGDFVRNLVERGFEHHTVLAWTDLRPQLRTFAKSFELDLVEP